MTVKELAEIANVSTSWVYNKARKLGRLPTLEELTHTTKGRPKKYGVQPIVVGEDALNLLIIKYGANATLGDVVKKENAED